MSWICAENSVANTGMFSLLLSSACTAWRPFLLLTHPTSEEAGGAQGAGGDTAGTADPNRPKEYSKPYDVMLGIQSWGKKKDGGEVWSYGVCLPK